MAKLLLVEDDNNLREIYAARLEAEGHEVHAAADGEEALATAVKVVPDLVILDVMMPKISGFDVLDILRSTPETKNAKIIMMTALSQQSDKERGEKLGTDRYLIKSQVTLEDVVNTVSELVDGGAAPTPPTEAAPAAAPEPPVGVPEGELNTAMAGAAAVATDPDPAAQAASPAPAPDPATSTPAPEPSTPDPTPVVADETAATDTTPPPAAEPTEPAQGAAPTPDPAPAPASGLVVEETDDQNIQEPTVEKTMQDGNPENDNPGGLASAQADESADINKQIEVLTSEAPAVTPPAPEEPAQPSPEDIQAAVESVESPAPATEEATSTPEATTEQASEESPSKNGKIEPLPPSGEPAQSVLGPEHLSEEAAPSPLPGDAIHPNGDGTDTNLET